MNQDEFNTIAWRDFLMFAIYEDGIIQRFRAATGLTLFVPPMDKLASHPAGGDPDDEHVPRDPTLLAFVDFVTKEIWGLEHAPASWKADYTARTGQEL